MEKIPENNSSIGAPQIPSPLGLSSRRLDEESFLDRYVIMPKLIYFMFGLFYYAYSATMYFFFIDTMKFQQFHYGYINFLSIFTFFGSMFWCNLADKTGRYKTIIIISSVFYTISCCFLAVNMFGDNQTVRLCYNIFFFILFNVFGSAIYPLLDSMILGMLAKNPRVGKEQIGNQRLFSAFGHLKSTLMSLFLYEKAGENFVIEGVLKRKAFYQMIMLIVFLVLFVMTIVFGVSDVQPVKGGHGHHHGSDPKNQNQSTKDQSKKSRTMQLITNPSFLFFMVFIFFGGILNQVMHMYQKSVANHVFEDNKIMASLVDFSRTFSEVAVYFFSKQIRAFMGVYWVLVFSQLAGTLRLGLYACLGENVNPTISKISLFIIELLKGLNSGLVSSSAIMIASNLAPAGCEGTAQGMYSGVYKGFSAAFGSIISGIILQILFKRKENERQVEKAKIEEAEEEAKNDTYSDKDSMNKAIKMAKEPTKKMDQQDIRSLFTIVSISSIIVTVLLSCKFIFIDRVMGIPGFPRRH